jgi:hypothetical protein
LIIERATSGAGFTQPWWYYLGTWAWQLLPWTGALLLAAGPSLRRALQQRDAPDRFLWCWAIIPIVLLSFSKGKHHHYIISCLCAFTPLIALGLLRLGKRVAIASTVIAVLGCLYVHARVLPARDPARHDREFLASVRSSVTDGVPLFAIGGVEIARHIFYVDPPPEGLWIHNFDERLRETPAFFAIARRSFESQLAAFGRVRVVRQSVQTRKERSPADRFTLFHVEADPSLRRSSL